MAPLFERGFENGLEDRDARVVDERVDAAEACVHGRHRVIHLLGPGHIAAHGEHTFGVGQRRIAARQCVAIDVDQRDPPALAQKPACHGQADAACTACDHGHGRRRRR